MSSKQLRIASKITLNKVRVPKAPQNIKFHFQMECFKCKHEIERNSEDNTILIYCLGQDCQWTRQTRYPCASPSLIQGSLKIKGAGQNKSHSFESIQVSSKQNNLKFMTQQRFGLGSYSTQNWIDQDINYVFKSNYLRYSSSTAAALRFNIDNHHYLPLEIFKSQIPGAGYGMRATQELQPNRIVMPYIGAIIKSQCYVPPSDSVFEFGWLKIGKQIHPLNLQPVKKLNAARYINSCFVEGKISTNEDDFNCVMHFGIVGDSVYLFLVTKRLIQPFQQLTYSYNKLYQLQKSYQKAGTVTEMIDLDLKNSLKQSPIMPQGEQKDQMSLMQEEFNSMCHIQEKQKELALKQFMNGTGEPQQCMQEQNDDKKLDKIRIAAQNEEDNLIKPQINQSQEDERPPKLIETEAELYRYFSEKYYVDYMREAKLFGEKFSQAQCIKSGIIRWQSFTKSEKQNLKTEFNRQIIWKRQHPKLPSTHKQKVEQLENVEIDVQIFNKNIFNDHKTWIQTTQYNFNKLKNHSKKDWIQLCQRIFWMQLYSFSGEPYSEDFYISGFSDDKFGMTEVQNTDSYSCQVCENHGQTKILCLRRMIQHMKKSHKIFTTAVKLNKLVYSGKKFFILQTNFSQHTGLKLDDIISMTDCQKTYKNNIQKIGDNDFYYIVQNYKLFINEKNTLLRNYNQRKDNLQGIQIPNQKVLERFDSIVYQRQQTDESWDNRKVIHIVYGPHGFGKTFAFNKICEARKDRYMFNALQLTRMDTFQANILSLHRKKSYKGPLTIFIDELDSTEESKLKPLLAKLIQLVKKNIINLYGICNVLTQKIVKNFQSSGIQVKNHVYRSYDKVQIKNFINKSLQKHGLFGNIEALDILQQIKNLRLVKDVIQKIKLNPAIYRDSEQLKKLTSSQFNQNLTSSEQNLSPNQMIIISKLLQFDQPIPKQFFDRIGLQIDVQDLVDQKVIKSTLFYIKSIDDDANKVNVLTQNDDEKSFKMHSSRDLYHCKFAINLLTMLQPKTDFPRLSRQNRGNYLNFFDISTYRTQYQRRFSQIIELYPSVILPQLTRSDVQQGKMNYFDLLNCAYLKIKNEAQSAVTDLDLWQLDYPFGRAFFVRGPHGVGKKYLIRSKLISQCILDHIQIDLKVLQNSKKSLVQEIINKLKKVNKQDAYFSNKQCNIQSLVKWFNQSNKKIVFIFKNVDLLIEQCHDKTMYQLAQIMTDADVNNKLSLIFLISQMSYSLKSKVKSRIRVVDLFFHRSQGPVLVKRIMKKKMQIITNILKQSSTTFSQDEISYISNKIWHAFQNKYIGFISEKSSVDRSLIFNKFHQFLIRGASILDSYLSQQDASKKHIMDSVQIICEEALQSMSTIPQFTDMQISVFTISMVLSQQRKLITPYNISQFSKQLKKDARSVLNLLHQQTYAKKILDEMVRSKYYKVNCKNYFISYSRNEFINLFSKSINQGVPHEIRDLLKQRNLI